MNRRQFILGAAASCMVFNIPFDVWGSLKKNHSLIKIGIISDLHQDIMHDAPLRLKKFIDHSKKIGADAIIQLGDFAYPGIKNKEIIENFNRANKNALHVIGNHDTDAGYTKEQCIDCWGMPDRYYAYKLRDVWLVVLDGNDKGSSLHRSGYQSFVDKEQVSWLRCKLEEIDGPVIIFSHQPLAGHAAVDNAVEIQEILGNFGHKIMLAVNGHTHTDNCIYVKGIPYVHINSASYFWVGEKYKHESYGKDVHEGYPWICCTCPYRNALFAMLTIDPLKGKMYLEGKTSEWVGESPAELGYVETEKMASEKGIVPFIRNYEF